jgi:hypothetical protein
VALLAISLGCNTMFGPLAGRGIYQTVTSIESVRPDASQRTLARYRDRMVAEVPRDGGVVAGFEFLSRFTRRADAHAAHHVLGGLYTFSRRHYPSPRGVTAFIADLGDERLLRYVTPGTSARMRELLAENHLAPVDVADGLVLYTSDPSDSLELVSFGDVAPDSLTRVVFDGQIAFLGAWPESGTARAGGTFELVTEWRRVASVNRMYTVQLELADASGAAVHGSVHALGYGRFPAHEWPVGQRVRERARFVLRDDLKPGAYTLAIRLAWQAGEQSGISEPDLAALRATGGFVPIARITVEGAGPP